MNIIKTYDCDCFFAAANSFSGFQSLFDKVFDPRDYSRLFILKGGPGTGKSTLMRHILEHGIKMGYHTEGILCSSDTKSLDGVIIGSDNGKYAVIDGTAPHTRDAMYPGAIDEIINLGDGFDTIGLGKRIEDIKELSSQKALAYKSAYKYLEAAGSINHLIREQMNELVDYSAAESIVRDLIRNSERAITPPRWYYISAFGKDGYVRIEDKTDMKTKTVKIGGDTDLSIILSNFLYERFSLYNKVDISCPSPFDINDVELFIAGDLKVYSTPDSEYDIDSNSILRKSLSQRILELRSYRESLLSMAQESMQAAAMAHFSLEEIYSSYIDFSHNNMILSTLIERIDNSLH